MRDTDNDTCMEPDRFYDGATVNAAVPSVSVPNGGVLNADASNGGAADAVGTENTENGVRSGRGASRVRRRSARRAAARAAKRAAEGAVDGAAADGAVDGAAGGTADRYAKGASKRAAADGTVTGGRDGIWAQVIGASSRDVSGHVADGRFEPTISKERVAELPPVAFGGEIVIVDRAEAIDRACDELLACPLVGFDTESRPSFQKGTVNRISLLQLSTDDKCFLFRLNKIRLDKAILKVLGSTATVKVGLSVAGDIRELETLRRFDPRGFIDLQKVAPQHGITDQSLVRIAAITLGRRISKAQRLSNWEAVALTDAQKTYAATDAWICTEIYRELTCGAAPRPMRRGASK